MKNIAVIIRVYSRVDDAKAQVEIINKFWKNNKYTLFVVFNGKPDGYALDESLYSNAEVIEVLENNGHINGAADLVQKGYAHIKDKDFDYVLFLESDFWLLDENMIENLIDQDKELSSTYWSEKRKSLAVDFVLIKKEALDRHSEILFWDNLAVAEMTFRDSVQKAGLTLCVNEALRCVHAPKLMTKMCKKAITTISGGGRFNLFPKAKVLTHHVEELYRSHKHLLADTATIQNSHSHISAFSSSAVLSAEELASGMAIKKAIANTLLEEEFFEGFGFHHLSNFEKYAQPISLYIPQSSWIKKLFSKN